MFQNQINELQDKNVGTLRHMHTLVARDSPLHNIRSTIEDSYSLQRAMFTAKFSAKIIVRILTKIPAVLLYVIGGWFVLTGQISLGAIVASVAANASFQDRWSNVFTFYRTKESARVQFDRISALAGL